MSKRGKYNKTIKFLLPKLPVEKLKECIDQHPPTFNYQIDSFYSFLWDIIHQLSKVDDGEFAPLHSGILQDKYVNYTDYREYLILNQIILHNPSFEVEKHSMGYQINPDLLARNIIQVEIDIYSNAGRYIINRRNKEIQRAKKFNKNLKLLRKHFINIKFDFDGAYSFIEEAKQLTDYQYICAMDSINRFKDDNKKLRYFKRNKTNSRIDSNLSSLPSYLKQFINVNDILVQLDLKNSQPVLFNIILDFIYHSNCNTKPLTLCYKNNTLKISITLIGKEFKKNRKWVPLLKEEMETYIYYTSNGTWYEHLAGVYNAYYKTDSFDREKMKSKWMAIAYSSNKSINYKEDKIPFEKEFPIIGKIIRMIKQREYNQFAISLQQIEASIFIDLIAPKLIENDITPLTNHDCVIVQEHQVNEAHIIIKQVLQEQLGVEPKIDIEPLKEMTEIKPPRPKQRKKRVKRKKRKPQLELVESIIPVVQYNASKAPVINLKEMLNQFIDEHRGIYMDGIGRNKKINDKLIELSERNELKLVLDELNKYGFSYPLQCKLKSYYFKLMERNLVEVFEQES
jgi:hypothetical protein